MKSLTTNEQFKFSSTGIQIHPQTTFDQWQATGQYLQHIEGAIHWWIGDLFNYGEARWGEACYQIVDGYDFAVQTIRNDKWVAKAVPASLRRDTLHYSHHVEIASLEPNLQDELLNLAEEENLTVRELRQKVKAMKMQKNDNDEEKYRKIMWRIINDITILAENYPSGIDEIKIYLEMK